MKELIANIILIGFSVITYIALCWLIPLADNWNRKGEYFIKETLKLSAAIHAWTFGVLAFIGLFMWAFYVKMGVL